MLTSLKDTVKLHNGVEIPRLGLGVFKVEEGDEVQYAVRTAIENGYKSIDTAAGYHNEVGVGQAIKDSGVNRDDIFVTTKVWNAKQGYESTLNAFEDSRKKLGLEVVDLYLIHWPVKGKYLETWRAFEKLYKDGFVRAIGVSNFQVHHLKDIQDNFDIVPMVNQIEYHPLMTQKVVQAYCVEHNIQVEAWSPLMQGNLDHDLLKNIGKKYGKSPAQVVIRWDLQHGVVTIPKSVREERIKENADVFDFQLTQEEMDQIDAMNENKRFGSDPDNFNF